MLRYAATDAQGALAEGVQMRYPWQRVFSPQRSSSMLAGACVVVLAAVTCIGCQPHVSEYQARADCLDGRSAAAPHEAGRGMASWESGDSFSNHACAGYVPRASFEELFQH